MANDPMAYPLSVVDGLFHRLGQGFRAERPEVKEGVLFNVIQRHPKSGAGERWEDGQRDKRYRGPTGQQLRAIAATSPSRSEAVERLYQLVVLGRDTTVQHQQPQAPAYDEAKLNEIVAQKVAELLRARLQDLEQAPDPKPLPVGSRQKPPRKSIQQYQQERAEKFLLWSDRAQQLGIEPPVKRLRDGHIDGNWLRRAERLWQERIAAKT